MKKKKFILLSLAAAVLLSGAAWGISRKLESDRLAAEEAQYLQDHVFIEDAVYPRDADELDLRGSGISAAHFDALQSQLPQCRILWDVPFQGGTVSSDTETLTLTALGEEDLEMLDYLPRLKTVDALGCTDYPQLLELQKRRPDCAVTYRLNLGDQTVPGDISELTFQNADPVELTQMLPYLPNLETVHFVQPAFPAEDLTAMVDAFPNIVFTWEKDVLGTTYREDLTELDLSGIQLEGVEEIEHLMGYFPNLRRLDMSHCGIDGETMAAFRDRARDRYKVVWSIQIQFLSIPTDTVYFAPIKYGLYVTDIHMGEFHYLEDLVLLDLGHKGISNIDFIWKMPHLKYLILADTEVSDITPIGSLKELEYLELFKTKVTDYSPLEGCTALRDVNLAFTSGDASVFARMPWLRNLWINQCGVDDETRELLINSLPDTQIEFDHTWHLGNSWRGLPNYFLIRDLLEMPYYDWGNEVGRPGDPDYPYDY